MFRIVFDDSTNDVLASSDRDLIQKIGERAEPEIRAHLPALASDVEIRVEARAGWEIIPPVRVRRFGS